MRSGCRRAKPSCVRGAVAQNPSCASRSSRPYRSFWWSLQQLLCACALVIVSCQPNSREPRKGWFRRGRSVLGQLTNMA
eukprot:6469360-Amphidinium_carterae.1